MPEDRARPLCVPGAERIAIVRHRDQVSALHGVCAHQGGPLYEDLELWYPKIRLEEEGARTVVAGTGERTYQGKRGYPLTVDTNV